MADIATISLRVNTSELERGNQALDSFQQSANKAAQAADGVGQSTGKMAASSDQIKKASDYFEKYSGGIDAYTKSLTRRVMEEHKVGDAVAFQNGELEKLLERINPLNKAFGELDNIAQKLSQAKDLNLIDEVVFTRYQAILDSTSDKLYKAEAALTAEGQEKIKNVRITEQLEESQKKLIQSLNSQAATFRASKSEVAEYRAAQLGISEQAAPIIASLREQEKALERESNQKRIAAIQSKSLKQAIKEMEAAERAATLEAKRADDSRKSFVKSLSDQANAIGKTRTELLELKAAEMGVSAQAAPFIAKLREQDDAWKTGAISAGQYRQAIRMLPAQFTDIATSIAGGMPLWLILMQQGGQIKDSFGGIGNIFEIIKEKLFGLNDASDEASDSLSDSANGLADNAENAGKLSSFLSPTKIGILGLAGAVVSLSIAWYQGSKELSEFNKSLILTGNLVGMTSGQLADMAQLVAENTGNPVGISAEALNRVVSGGKIAKAALQSVTEAVVAMNDATGESIDSLVSDFERIAKSPVTAVSELNDKYRFLTLATYDQIKALQDEGNFQEAARVATEIYSATLNQRAGQIQESLGSLQKAWKWLGDEAKGAWDSMLDIGREVSIEQKIQDASSHLERVQKELFDLQKGQTNHSGAYGPWKSGDLGRLEKAESLAKERLDGLLSEKTTWDLINGSISERNTLEQKGIAAQLRLDAQAERMASNEVKRKKELLQLERDIADARAAGKIVTDEAERRKEINDKYKDPVTPKGKVYTPPAGIRAEDSAQADLLALQAQLQTLKEHKSANDVISQQRKALWDFQSKITILQQAQDGPLKRQLSAQEQSLLASSRQTLSLKEQLAVLGDQITAQEQLNKRMDSAQKYVTQMDEKGEALESASTISSRMASQRATLAQLRIGWKNAGGSLDDDGFKQQEGAAERYFAKEEALRDDWQAGVKRGFAEFADDATDTYGQVSRITQNAFQGMSVSITDFLFEGKAGFDDFLKTFLKGIAQMMVQMAMLNTMKMAFAGTGVGSFLGFANGGLVPAFDTGGYTGDGGKFEPKGVVHGGEFVFTKAATEALGVSNLYSLMRGAQGYAEGGVVGKAPMASIPALMPGYSPAGAGITVSMGDVVISGGNQQQPTGQAPAGDAIMKQLKPAIVATVSEQANKPGTPLWNAINGKR